MLTFWKFLIASIYFSASLLGVWFIFLFIPEFHLQPFAIVFDILPALISFWVFFVIIRHLVVCRIKEKTEIFWLFSLALAVLFYGFYALTWILFFRQFGLAATLNSFLHLFGVGMLLCMLLSVRFKLRMQLSFRQIPLTQAKARIRHNYLLPAALLVALVMVFLLAGDIFAAAEIFYSGSSLLWLWGTILLIKNGSDIKTQRALYLFLASSAAFVASSVLYGWQLRLNTYYFGGIVDWLHGFGALLLLLFVFVYLKNRPDQKTNDHIFFRLRLWLPGMFVIIAIIVSYAVYSYIQNESLAQTGQANLVEFWPRLAFELVLVWFVTIALSVLSYVLVSKQADLRKLLQSRTASLRRRVKALADSKYFLDNINDGIIVAALDGKIQYANQTAARFFALPLSGLKQKKINYFFTASQTDSFAQALALCKKNRTWHGELAVAKANSRRVLSASLQSFGQDPARLMLVVSDITKRKQIEEDKTQFVAFVAHQLREPLVQMRWLTEQLIAEKHRPAIAENLTMLHESVLHETDFVRQLLDVSRLERGILKVESRPHACLNLITEALQSLRHKAEMNKVEISVLPIPKSLKIIADRGKLVEVLRNIIDNAIKYTRENSRVTIGAEIQDQEVAIFVSDQGQGIPIELQDKIFEIKSRNDQRHQRSGAGLGLHFSHRLVKAMGGQIKFITSAQGTTFTVSLPAVKNPL